MKTQERPAKRGLFLLGIRIPVFLPASTDLIAGLVAQYRATKASMEELVDVFKRPDINTALSI